MKYTAAKKVVSSKAKKSERPADRAVKHAPVKASPKGKPRILGTGTFQKKEHSPRVV